ncbi:MAG: Fic family protein [Acholeplasmataceae bacterium]
MKDPYIYKDCDALINKASIKDKDKLDEFENRMTNLAVVLILKEPLIINSTNDIFTIHQKLFENVYDWAGMPRNIDIYKEEPILNGRSVEYAVHQQIIKELKKLDLNYLKNDLKSLKKEDFIHVFTRMIAEIWKVHPFREGNTRTVSVFALLFLKQYGYDLNTEFISQNAKYFRNALVMASIGEYAEYQYLQNILIDAISDKIEAVKEGKYSKIKDYQINQYKHVYHKVK